MEQAERLSRTARVSGGRRWRLLVEYLALFVLLPAAYALDAVPLPLFPALWLVAGVCLAVLRRDPRFERRRLWNAHDLGPRVTAALIPFVLAAPMLAWFAAIHDPDRLFGFVRQRPLLWAAVMVLYPVLSVYPQGLVYRVFVLHRYRDLFPSRWGRIAASAAAFSAVHVVFENWIAPLLTLAGGVLFAWTYDRTRSSLVAGIQHAAFGGLLFTLGLGWYFYHGAVR